MQGLTIGTYRVFNPKRKLIEKCEFIHLINNLTLQEAKNLQRHQDLSLSKSCKQTSSTKVSHNFSFYIM
jgi:hypothetical protein